jgi:NADH-quinone oxidoreductase subunit J
MGLNEALFALFAAGALASAMAVVVTRNTVYAALHFVGHLLCLAAIYSLLHAPLLGVLQVMVYAGAVMVLFLFAVMILDIPQQEEQDLGAQPWQLFLGGLVALTFAGMLFGFSHGFKLASALAPAGDPAKPAVDTDNIAAVARVLFRDYALAFETTGFLLLAAVVAVMVMAKRKLEN